MAGAVLALASSAAVAADVQVSGEPWTRSIGAAQLQAGAGSDFASPVLADESLTLLSISGTNGAAWIIQVSLVGNPLTWPDGVVLELRRAGGLNEAGIVEGLVFEEVTLAPQPFFSGTGDYADVEILVRLSGFDVETPPDDYTIGVQFQIVII
jgi:hypothetical protein